MLKDIQYKRLFELLRCAIGGQGVDSSVFRGVSADEWAELINLSVEQYVTAVAFDAVQTLPDDCRPDIDNLMEWLGQSNYVEEECKGQFEAAKELADICHRNGIRCFVMKGFSLGALYPKANYRSSCDLDCYCIDKDGNWCGSTLDSLLEEQGVKVDRSYYKNSKFTFHGLTVENHRHVLPVKGSKKAKELEKVLLGFLVSNDSKFLGDSYLESPSELFLAVHTLAHAQEHFLNEGISLRHVCDWAVILRRFQKVSDVSEGLSFWGVWQETCERFGLLKFGYALSRLANKVCGVEIPVELRGESLTCPEPVEGEVREQAKADELLLSDILHAKHSETKNDNARRVELITNIFRDSWKFKYFSDTTAFAFALSRIWGFLFEKD